MPTVLIASNKQAPDAVFGATGALMALRRDGGKVELRSTQRGQLIRVLAGDPASGDNLVALSPDGSRVAVSSDEGLRLWNAHSGRSIGSLPLPARDRPVFEVTFNQEGSIVGLTGTGSVLLWPGPTMWAELLCAKLTRNISRQQWQEWVSPEIEYRVQCAGLKVPE